MRRRLLPPIVQELRPEYWCLRGVRWDRLLGPEARADWHRRAELVRLNASEPLPEWPEEWVAVVERGRVRLLIPEPETPRPSAETPSGTRVIRPRWMQVAGPGDLLGRWQSLGVRDSVETLTVQQTRLRTMPAEAFATFLRRWEPLLPAEPGLALPGWERWLRRRLERRRRRTTVRAVPVEGLWRRSRNSRVAWLFLELAARLGRWTPQGLQLPNRWTAGAIAALAALEPDWCRWWLRSARAEGILHAQRGRWWIRDPWQLRRWADQPDRERIFRKPPDPWEEPAEPIPEPPNYTGLTPTPVHRPQPDPSPR